MLTFFKNFVKLFLYDELSFVRWMRGLMLTFAAGGIGFADSLAAVIGSPGAVRNIKIAAVVCGFIAGAITAGEKNVQSPAETPK